MDKHYVVWQPLGRERRQYATLQNGQLCWMPTKDLATRFKYRDTDKLIRSLTGRMNLWMEDA